MSLGVSGAFLKEFAALLAEKGVDELATTKDVCTMVVAPATAAHNCAYIDLEAVRAKAGHVGPATVFVSHAWKYPLRDSISVMLAFHERHPETFFWFDLFANNQGGTVTHAHEWWSTTFKTSIRSIGAVLVILSPWSDPVPLTRAWCLWEILCAIDLKVQFLVRLPIAEYASFREAVLADFHKVMDTLVRVSAEKAEASNDVDKEMIFEAIRGSVGFAGVNERIKDQMREWFVSVSQLLIADMRTAGNVKSDEFLLLCVNVGSMLSDFGEYERAIGYFNQALSTAILHGKDLVKHEVDRAVALAFSGLGVAHKSKGKYEDAVEFYSKSLKLFLSLEGEKGVDVAEAYINLGSAYRNLHEHDRAVDCYHKGLSIFKEFHGGEQHAQVARTYNSLGLAHSKKGDWDKAIAHYEHSLQIFKETLGDSHPDTARAYNSLAGAFYETGNVAKAIEFYERDLAIKIDTLGERHPRTAKTLHSLASICKLSGDSTAAESYSSRAAKADEGSAP